MISTYLNKSTHNLSRNVKADYLTPRILGAITLDKNSGGTAGPVLLPVYNSYVLSLDGNDIINFPSPVLVPTGASISGYFRAPDISSPRCLWSSTNDPKSYSYLASGVVNVSSTDVDKVFVDGFETTAWPSDNNMHKIEVIFNKDVWIDRIGLSHTNIFGFVGEVRDLNINGEGFLVDDNSNSIVGSSGTTLTLTGGTWNEYEVDPNV